ncbi:hypothetical protein TYRP_020352 [Tyrophagus putrescentiae]|nr:hypothetical protein TYRP_020352 [Tyrophagus putrescentiae]
MHQQATYMQRIEVNHQPRRKWPITSLPNLSSITTITFILPTLRLALQTANIFPASVHHPAEVGDGGVDGQTSHGGIPQHHPEKNEAEKTGSELA